MKIRVWNLNNPGFFQELPTPPKCVIHIFDKNQFNIHNEIDVQRITYNTGTDELDVEFRYK